MFEEDITAILKSAGIETTEDKLETPPQEEFGDLSFTCFGLAKEQKRNPNEIANEIVSKIKIHKGSVIEKVEAKGAYVNFFFNYAKLAELVLKGKKELPKIGKGKTYMVEFAHPNTHKGFHIGHLRNITIGESLSRILEFSGYKVVRTNYEGDIGPHVAKCLWGILNLYKGRIPKENKGEWLGKAYAEASQKIGVNPDLEKEVDEINKKLYEGEDKKLLELWKKTRQWSLDYFDGIYKEVGTRFDKLYFESQIEKRGIEISKEAIKKGVAKVSEGAVIIGLEKYELGIFVLITKDGTPLYSAKDLGLAEKEFTDFNPDYIIHVVGSEQTFYFKQLFKTFELIKSKVANKSYHLVYGLVRLQEGKMSSREGTVILYTDLRNKVVKKVAEEIKQRNPKLPKKFVEDLALKIGVSALKYQMLKISPEKDVAFDWQQSLELQGDTGPYIQYAYTRCTSILKKAKKWKNVFSVESLNDEEKKIVKLLSNFTKIVEQSSKDLRPHYVCNYSYDLSTVFNNFYEKHRVLNAETDELKNFRLNLVKATQTVLGKCLELMGMHVVEKM